VPDGSAGFLAQVTAHHRSVFVSVFVTIIREHGIG